MSRVWIVLALAAAGCTERGFDTVCQLSKDILAEPRITPEMRLQRFEEQIGHFASGEALAASNAALAAPNGERTAAFMTVATEAVPGWRCSSLQPVLDAPATN